MNRNLRIIVAHPGRQHSYRLAEALKSCGCLLRYATTYYSYSRKPNVISRLIPRAKNRRCESLDDSEVVTFCTVGFFVVALLLRIDKRGRLYRMANDALSRRFGRRVARYAIEQNADAVVMYDATAVACFELLRAKAPHILRIQDVSAINRLYMQKIYADDMARTPDLAAELRRERGFLFDERNQKRWRGEIELSDHFLVPSKIVAESLAYSGVEPSQIFTCPYGTEFEVDRCRRRSGGRLEVVYVGSVTQMKGIFYLLEAVARLPENEFHLTVVGRYDAASELFRRYKARVDFVGYVMHDEVKRYLSAADVFVFPSLGDSFGLSVLEALSHGLPVICSDHAGASDAIIDGENGFVVSVCSIDAIVEKLKYCRDNAEFMESARVKAYATAERYTWDAYRENIARFVELLKTR